jgi:hydroxymethylpyrimidine pyrophosphatase-like HAD family hydrolase
MAAFFIDLDGTIFRFGTEEFLPNARESLLKLLQDGHQIVFTTLRGDAVEARKVLRKAGLNCIILTGVQSPRVVINDSGAHAIDHVTDAPWEPL